MEKKQGISLLVLTVVIILMLILAGTVIFNLIDFNTIDKAEIAVYGNNKEVLDEKIWSIESNYMVAYNMDLLSDTVKNELIEISNTTGVSIDKFTVYYDKAIGKDYIFYRLDKVTKDEVEKIEAIKNEEGQSKYYFLIYDANFDGVLTEADYNKLQQMNDGYYCTFVSEYVASKDSYIQYNSETDKVEAVFSVTDSDVLWSDYLIKNGNIETVISTFKADVAAGGPSGYHKESKTGTAYYTFASEYANQIESYNIEHNIAP